MKNKITLMIAAILLLCSSSNIFSQGVGIGDQIFTQNNSAILELQSSNKGLLIPRTSEAKRIQIPVNGVTAGLMVFQTDGEKGLWYWNGLQWKRLVTSSEIIVGGDESNFALVATTGDYEDLLNKPTILTRLRDFIQDTSHSTISQAERDRWNEATAREGFSGSYKDLTNKPEIPEYLSDMEQDVNYYTTASRAERDVWNSKADTSDVFVFLCDFKCDSNYYRLVSLTQKKAWNEAAAKPVFSGNYKDLFDKPILQTVATTGNYNDLYNRPLSFSVTTADGKTLNLSVVALTGYYEDLLDKPVITDKEGNALEFATVATTGNYEDLENRIDDNIPTHLSQLQQDANYYTTASLAEKKIWNGKADSSDMPKYLSDLQSDRYYLLVTDKEIIKWDSLSLKNFSGEWQDLKNRPTFAVVAMTGSYRDLKNSPSIDDLKTLLSLDTIAYNNDYKLLKQRPTIPTKLKDLTANMTYGYTTDAEIRKWDAIFDQAKQHIGFDEYEGFGVPIFSGNYNDINGKVTFPDAAKAGDSILADVASSGSWNDLQNKPSMAFLVDSMHLAKISTTGDFNDLSVMPTKQQLQTMLKLKPAAFTDDYYNPDGSTVLTSAPYPAKKTETANSAGLKIEAGVTVTGAGNLPLSFAKADHTHAWTAPPKFSFSSFAEDESFELITQAAFNSTMTEIGDNSSAASANSHFYVTLNGAQYNIQPKPNIQFSAGTRIAAGNTATHLANHHKLDSINNKTYADITQMINDSIANRVRNQMLDNAIPVGTVVMWSGNGLSSPHNDINNLPDCWTVVSGEDGSDFGGRFPQSATRTGGNAVNGYGGNAAITLKPVNMPDHTHTISIDWTTQNSSGSGNHWRLGIFSWNSSDDHLIKIEEPYISKNLLNDNATPITTTTPHENRPPFYAIFFIKKNKTCTNQ
jgi:hypothetical protein